MILLYYLFIFALSGSSPVFITSAQREVKDSCNSGMFQRAQLLERLIWSDELHVSWFKPWHNKKY